MFVLLGVDIDVIVELEFDVVFGNGGFGWLVVCFMEFMVMVDVFVYGYGICYVYGFFC